jgi:hypothetical protein
MNNQVILIEDKPSRSIQLLSDKQRYELEVMEFVTIPREDECNNIIHLLNNGDYSLVKEFDLIMIHRSALNHIGLRGIITLCKSNVKDIVLFSGGVSQIVYLNEGYQYLALHSRDFYSDNLFHFLNNYSVQKNISLLEIIYGEKWKLEQLIRFRRLQLMLDGTTDEFSRSLYEEELFKISKNMKVDSLTVVDQINHFFNRL